jgi:tetratricopeptide (TPR) repeat protein
MAHNLKALIFEQLEKFEDAIKCYQSALELVKKYSQEDPSSKITLQYNLAGAYFKNKEYDKAKQIFIEIQSLVTSEVMKANITKYLNMIK